MDKMDDNMALLLISRLMTAENQHTHHAAYNHIAARLAQQPALATVPVEKVRAFANSLTQAGSTKAGESWIRAQAFQEVGHRLNALLDQLG